MGFVIFIEKNEGDKQWVYFINDIVIQCIHWK